MSTARELALYGGHTTRSQHDWLSLLRTPLFVLIALVLRAFHNSVGDCDHGIALDSDAKQGASAFYGVSIGLICHLIGGKLLRDDI